jgi:hypothetical protein
VIVANRAAVRPVVRTLCRLDRETSVRDSLSATRPSAARRLIAASACSAVAAAALVAWPSQASAADVGVSISISEPGVYGRIDIGRFPQPALIVPQPVVVAPPTVVMARREPVYMWVPPGHRKHWSRYCGQYRACGAPVVFVRDDWYESHVRPHGRGDSGRGHGGHDDRRGHPGRGHDRRGG